MFIRSKSCSLPGVLGSTVVSPDVDLDPSPRGAWLPPIYLSHSGRPPGHRQRVRQVLVSAVGDPGRGSHSSARREDPPECGEAPPCESPNPHRCSADAHSGTELCMFSKLS